MSTAKLVAAVAVSTALVGGGAATLVANASQHPEQIPTPQHQHHRHHRHKTTLSDHEIARQMRTTVVRLIGRSGYGEQSGTGVVIDAEQGLVVTNAHVIAGVTSLRATVDGKDIGPATIEGQATCDDLAVVRLSSTTGLKAAKFGSSAALEPMDHVVAFGYPVSLEAEPTLSITPGEVSKSEISVNQGGAVAGDLPEYRSVIQHTALIKHGNSGGPLFNDRGEVVGINTLELDGQAWAISSDRVQELVDDLAAGDSPAYTGWSVTPIPQFMAGLDDTTGFEDLVDVDEGLIVTGVENDSPAAEAGLTPGSLVFELNDQPVNTVADVCAVLQTSHSGDAIAIDGYSVDVGDDGSLHWNEASTQLALR
jgi:S1-C subfamily serine protease